MGQEGARRAAQARACDPHESGSRDRCDGGADGLHLDPPRTFAPRGEEASSASGKRASRSLGRGCPARRVRRSPHAPARDPAYPDSGARRRWSPASRKRLRFACVIPGPPRSAPPARTGRLGPPQARARNKVRAVQLYSDVADALRRSASTVGPSPSSPRSAPVPAPRYRRRDGAFPDAWGASTTAVIKIVRPILLAAGSAEQGHPHTLRHTSVACTWPRHRPSCRACTDHGPRLPGDDEPPRRPRRRRPRRRASPDRAPPTPPPRPTPSPPPPRAADRAASTAPARLARARLWSDSSAIRFLSHQLGTTRDVTFVCAEKLNKAWFIVPRLVRNRPRRSRPS